MSSLDFLTEVIDVELKSDSPDEFENESHSDGGRENSPDTLLSSRAGPTGSTVSQHHQSLPGSSGLPPRKAHEREALEVSLQASHQTRNLFRSNLSVVTFHKTEYLIGVQVARRLKRKTFNMYRCMKKKKIELRRATQDEVDYLTLVGAVHPGTHSITLVPFDECLCFVADALFRHIRFPNEDLTAKRRKSFVSLRPRIHRRKPLPWDIQRSVRKTPPQQQEKVPIPLPGGVALPVAPPQLSDPRLHQHYPADPHHHHHQQQPSPTHLLASNPSSAPPSSSLPPYTLPKTLSAAGQVIYSLPSSFSPSSLPPSLSSTLPTSSPPHSSPPQNSPPNTTTNAPPSSSSQPPQIPPYSLGQCGFRPTSNPPLNARLSPTQIGSQINNSQISPQLHSQLGSFNGAQPHSLAALNPMGVIGFTR